MFTSLRKDVLAKFTRLPGKELYGAPGGTRTPDPLVRSQPLCPLSYRRARSEGYCSMPPGAGTDAYEKRLTRNSDTASAPVASSAATAAGIALTSVGFDSHPTTRPRRA